MSEISKIENPAPAAQPARPIPENLPEELLPVYDWWHAKGRQTVTVAAIALAIVALGLIVNQNHKARSRQAVERLLAADSIEELEALVSQYGRTGAGRLAQLRLAKAYYDAGQYDNALARYDAYARKASDRFADIAVIGRAHVLEAKGEVAAAQAAFAAFRQENPDHFLTPQAILGEARCLAVSGDKEAARKLLDLLIAVKAGTDWEDRAGNLKEIVARYEKREAVSLFDQADLLLPGARPTTPDAADAPQEGEEPPSTPPGTPARVQNDEPAPAAEPAAPETPAETVE